MKPLTRGNKAVPLHHLLKIAIVLFALCPHDPLQAQVVADDTLPANSRVKFNGNTFEIDGGTTVGGNLFHSFTEFSVPTSHEAFFNNPGAIRNIISRVTGENISQIDGLIRANSSASLFLINPKGIVFGPNASLNIGGSFIGSTANSLRFADGTQFSATDPQVSPLLTVSVPIGLQYGQNPGAIRVLGKGYGLTIADSIFSTLERDTNPTGLRVQPGHTLALIGGNVTLEGSTLTAEGGRIELGSVVSAPVELDLIAQTWSVNYDEVENFGNIQLFDRALADVSGAGSGSIQVQGARVAIADGSVLLSQNLGAQAGGSINVNASQFLEVTGTTPDGRIRSQLNTQALGLGNGGDIIVATPQLVLREGARLDTVTLSAAKGGDITVSTSEAVRLSGISPSFTNVSSLTSQIVARTQNSGKGGNIALSTARLTLLDGANVVSAANLGTGKGGDVFLNATQLAELIGVNPINFFSSSVGATNVSGGGAGNLTVKTGRLVLQDGGRVDASTFGNSDAGSVTIDASESIEVSGTVPGSRNPSLIISGANLTDSPILQTFDLNPLLLVGNSGDVTINTGQLRVTDGARVSVTNDGAGNAGRLRIDADSVVLDERGGITASTVSGNGGNIELQVGDLLLLQRNSLISAAAGSTGNGGNIDINTKILVATPNENSDIVANAFTGSGGRAEISAEGIFGLESRSREELEQLLGTDDPNQLDPQRLASNDITAISQSNPSLSGQVNINTLDADPSQGLAVLPAELVDVTRLIARSCPGGREPGVFIVTGNGGVPPNPREALRSEPALADLGTSIPDRGQRASAAISSNAIAAAPVPLVEAQGWAINNKGEAILTAQVPNTSIQIPWLRSLPCPFEVSSQ